MSAKDSVIHIKKRLYRYKIRTKIYINHPMENDGNMEPDTHPPIYYTSPTWVTGEARDNPSCLRLRGRGHLNTDRKSQSHSHLWAILQ